MKTDVLIVGGGPGGSATAMFLIREGIKPIIVEAETFPRYHIGESMTGAGGKVPRAWGWANGLSKGSTPIKRGEKAAGKGEKATGSSQVRDCDDNRNIVTWEI